MFTEHENVINNGKRITGYVTNLTGYVTNLKG